jgi:hypothetical protein
VLLKPIDRRPRRATLLNTGEPVAAGVDFLPSQHLVRKSFLRLRTLPAEVLERSVPVIKLEFDAADTI